MYKIWFHFFDFGMFLKRASDINLQICFSYFFFWEKIDSEPKLGTITANLFWYGMELELSICAINSLYFHILLLASNNHRELQPINSRNFVSLTANISEKWNVFHNSNIRLNRMMMVVRTTINHRPTNLP